MSGWDWPGLMSPCGLRLDADPHRFDEWQPPEPRPVVTHTVSTFSDFHYGDVGRGWWFFATCSCEWQSAAYRSGREADCAARLHAGALSGVAVTL